MNPERITPTELKNLILSEGPAITLVTSPDSNGSSRIQTKQELERLKKEARAAGLEVEKLIRTLEEDLSKTPGHFAFLRSKDVSLTIPIDCSVGAAAAVGKHFNPRILLQIANCQKLFYILALSQNRTRILECTERSSRELPFPEGYASSLEDSMQTRKPDHVLDNRQALGTSSAGSMGGVMSGTSTEREDKDEYMLHFFLNLDKAVNSLLKGRTEPLVIAGVEHELALYQRVNTYGHLVARGVHGAPDGLHGGEMHTRALELLATDSKDPRRVALADYEKKVGTGHASSHVQEIIVAAYEGRVSHLFFQGSAHYEGAFDEIRLRVKHHVDSLDQKADLIEEAAYQTVLHGGDAQCIPGSMMPNGVPVCAFFRYPEPATTTAQASTGSAMSV